MKKLIPRQMRRASEELRPDDQLLSGCAIERGVRRAQSQEFDLCRCRIQEANLVAKNGPLGLRNRTSECGLNLWYSYSKGVVEARVQVKMADETKTDL